MYSNKTDLDRHVKEVFNKLNTDSERDQKCYLLAKLYYKIKDYDSAIKYVCRYITNFRNTAQCQRLLGECYEGLKKPSLALDAYRSSLELDGSQRELVLKVCDLLSNPEVPIIASQASYWLDRVKGLFPTHPTVFKLKERIIQADPAAKTDYKELEYLILSEIMSRPNDAAVRIRFLNFLLDTKRVKSAQEQVAELLTLGTFTFNLNWFECLYQVHQAYEKEIGTNQSFDYQLQKLAVLERRSYLTLRDYGTEKKSIAECGSAVFSFDQGLHVVAKYLSRAPDKQYFQSVVQHFRYQLASHLAILKLKRAKAEPGEWQRAVRVASPFLMLGTRASTIMGRPETRDIARWRVHAAERVSVCAHVLRAMQETNDGFLKEIHSGCGGKWRERAYEKLFYSKEHQDAIATSCFVNDAAFLDLPAILPTDAELELYDREAQSAHLDCLHHAAWLGMVNVAPGGLLKPHFYSAIVPNLPLTTNNLENTNADTLSRLDVDAFLYATVFCNMSLPKTYVSGDRPSVLPLTITESLCTQQQADWWSSMYKTCSNQPSANNCELRLRLRKGIECVRAVGNHGMHPKLLVLLAKQFHLRVACTEELAGKLALEQRCEAYWRAALPLLERMDKNLMVREVATRLFDYQPGDWKQEHIRAAIEEGKLFLACQLMYKGEDEEAIEAFHVLKSPFATFYQAQIYKKLAREVASGEDSNKNADARSQHVILLTRARDALRLTEDRLRGAVNHPLQAAVLKATEEVDHELALSDTRSNYSRSAIATQLHSTTIEPDVSLYEIYAKAMTPKKEQPSPRQARTESTANFDLLIKRQEEMCGELGEFREEVANIHSCLSDIKSLLQDFIVEFKRHSVRVTDRQNMDDLLDFADGDDYSEDVAAAAAAALSTAHQSMARNAQASAAGEAMHNYAHPGFMWGGGLPFSEGQQLPDFRGLQTLQQPAITAPSAADYGNKVAPNVVVTSSESLPPVSKPSQLIVSVTIPPEHIRSAKPNEAATHAFQIQLPPGTTQSVQSPSVLQSPSDKYQARAYDQSPTSALATPNTSTRAVFNPSPLSQTPAQVYTPAAKDIPTPKVLEIEAKGTKLFDSFATLFHLDGSWKESCRGTAKIFHDDRTNSARLIVRNFQVEAVCANQKILPDMTLSDSPQFDSFSWIGQDESGRVEKLLIKFQSQDEAKDFEYAFNMARELVGKKKTPETTIVQTPTAYTFGTPSVSKNLFGTKQDTPTSVAPTSKPILAAPMFVAKSSQQNTTPVFGTKTTESTFSFGAKKTPASPLTFGSNNTPDNKITFCSTFSSTPATTLNFGAKTTPTTTLTFGSNVSSTEPKFSFGSSPASTVTPQGAPAFSFNTKTTPTVTDAEQQKDKLMSTQTTVFGQQTAGLDFSKLAAGQTADAFRTSSDFKGFAGAGKPLFSGNDSRSVATPDAASPDTTAEDYEPTVEFAPVIPLPDLVDVKTGEEDELPLFEQRAKIYRFDRETSAYKEKGVGSMKILHNPQSGKVRLLMRREQVHKLCCNHYLDENMEFKRSTTNEKTASWHAMDFSEESGRPEILAIRLKDVDSLLGFLKVIEDLQKRMKNGCLDGKSGKKQVDSSSSSKSDQKPLSELFAKKPGTWECDACLLRNAAEANKCAACETLRPGAVDSSPNKVTGSKQLIDPAVAATFSFGIPPAGSGSTSSATATDAKPTFSFGTPVPEKPASTFTFGTSTPTGFTFGAAVPTSPAQFAFGAKSTPQMNGNAEGSDFKLGSSDKFSFVFKKGDEDKNVKSPDQEQSDDDDVNDLEKEDENITFQPVVPLPEKIVPHTGEEDDDVLYCQRAKLYRFVDGEWKERGLGDVKVLKSKETSKVRLLMRREQVFKICMNHLLLKETSFIAKEKSWMWAAKDFADGTLSDETFCIKFRDQKIADEFKKAVDEAQNGLVSSPQRSKEDAVVTGGPSAARVLFKDDDPVAVFEFKCTPEQQAEALRLQLPANWFRYTECEPCAGCPGCDKDTDSAESEPVQQEVHKKTEPPKKPANEKEASVPKQTVKLAEPVIKFGLLPKPTETIFGSNAKNYIEPGVEAPKAADPETPKSSVFSNFSFKTAVEPTSFFGNTTDKAKPVFGSSSGNIFGNAAKPAPPTSSSLFTFGQKSTPSTNSTPIFGQTTAPVPSMTTPIFGQNTASTDSTSIFGQTTAATNSTPIFGTNESALSFASLAKENTSVFGNTAAPTWGRDVKPVFGGSPASALRSPNKDDSDEEGHDDADHDPQFKPIIDLPDTVEVSTGEEDEEKLFCERAKLFRYETKTGEWKERGIGEMKILHNPKENSYRLILRREQVHKVVCNMRITSDLKVEPMNKSVNSWLWAGVNCVDSKQDIEKLAVRFKLEKSWMDFKQVVDDCVQKLKEIGSTNTSRDTVEAEAIVEEVSDPEEEEGDDEDEDETDEYGYDGYDYEGEEGGYGESILLSKEGVTLSVLDEATKQYQVVGEDLGLQVLETPDGLFRLIVEDYEGGLLADTHVNPNSDTPFKVPPNSLMWISQDMTQESEEYKNFRVDLPTEEDAQHVFETVNAQSLPSNLGDYSN